MRYEQSELVHLTRLNVIVGDRKDTIAFVMIKFTLRVHIKKLYPKVIES